MLAVNVTDDDVPGYSVVAAVPTNARFELVPTVPVPEPEPVVVKYASSRREPKRGSVVLRNDSLEARS